MLKQYKLRDYNFRLVLWLIALSTLGVLLVGSAEASLENKQLAGVILGVFIMLILSLIDFSWILNFYWIIYGVNILLLLLIHFVPLSLLLGLEILKVLFVTHLKLGK